VIGTMRGGVFPPKQSPKGQFCPFKRETASAKNASQRHSYGL
jgi:hypothetical protein